jgi:hypothetical protein
MNLPISTATVNRTEAVSMIRNARGMVSVYVVKRKDGSLRRFNGFAACNITPEERAKVTNGTGSAMDPLAHDLIPFYEMVSEVADGVRMVKGKAVTGKVRRTIGKQFRHVAIEGIRTFRANGVTYSVTD